MNSSTVMSTVRMMLPQSATVERIVQRDRNWVAALADQSHVAPLLPGLMVAQPC
jgi:hypothetical protein